MCVCVRRVCVRVDVVNCVYVHVFEWGIVAIKRLKEYSTKKSSYRKCIQQKKIISLRQYSELTGDKQIPLIKCKSNPQIPDSDGKH